MTEDSRTAPAAEAAIEIESASIEVARLGRGVARILIQSEPLGVLRQGVKRAIGMALNELENDQDIRCVILTGRGRAFSVGSDVREFRPEVEWQRQAALTDQGLNLAIERARFPVIAACNGLTLGGGAEMALACDIRIAGTSSRFGWPEVQVGTFASAGATQRLPEQVGAGRAMELLLTGRIFDADEARRIGLVQEVVPDEALWSRALSLAVELASRPAMALAITKRCVVHGLWMGREAGHQLENEMTEKLGVSADAIEGQAAFLEKRPPRFNL